LVIALRLKVNLAINLELIVVHYLKLVTSYLLIDFNYFDFIVAKEVASFTVVVNWLATLQASLL
jgi:hypothetical protein